MVKLHLKSLSLSLSLSSVCVCGEGGSVYGSCERVLSLASDGLALLPFSSPFPFPFPFFGIAGWWHASFFTTPNGMNLLLKALGRGHAMFSRSCMESPIMAKDAAMHICVALFVASIAVSNWAVLGVHHEHLSGTAGDVLEDDPFGRLKVFVYELPSKYNQRMLEKDSRCLRHMFATEIYVHQLLLSSPVRTLNPEEADWFYTPVYTTCDLTTNGFPLPFKSPRMMRSAIQYISNSLPYWNRTEGADHFFVVPHDFGACFHYQEEQAIKRGILPVLLRATLVQTFGQSYHACLKDGSIVIPPYCPPQKMENHLIPPHTPRSIFVYFRGLYNDAFNDPEGGYYARGARASVWANFKSNPVFDISTFHPATYYEDMQRAVFCLCPLGWAPWSPRLAESVVFGCIPVIIADDIVLPFTDAIPWNEIAVFVPEIDVPKLDTILTSIPPEEIIRKQRLLANPAIKQAMLFTQPAHPGDAFHQILNGLARKLPHDNSIYIQPGNKFLNWKSGPPGDLQPWDSS